MHIIKKEKGEQSFLQTKVIAPEDMVAIGSPIAIGIVKAVAERPMSVSELSKHLKCHEQTIYYHIGKLKKTGFIKPYEDSSSSKKQTLYKATASSFSFAFEDFKKGEVPSINESSFFSPFIKNGRLNAKIIVGSPDPHGPENARSRDSYYGIDFALFLGTFLNYVPHSYALLDTEVRSEDLKQNLIIIGGPIVNKITDQINSYFNIRFVHDKAWSIYSTISGKKYFDDETGLIVKQKNPFSSNHYILLIAGKRYVGTKSAIVAFLKKFSEIKKGNIYDRDYSGKVVMGLDLDSDGNIDDVEILE